MISTVARHFTGDYNLREWTVQIKWSFKVQREVVANGSSGSWYIWPWQVSSATSVTTHLPHLRFLSAVVKLLSIVSDQQGSMERLSAVWICPFKNFKLEILFLDTSNSVFWFRLLIAANCSYLFQSPSAVCSEEVLWKSAQGAKSKVCILTGSQ